MPQFYGKRHNRKLCWVCWKEYNELKRTVRNYFTSFEATHKDGTIHYWSVLHTK